MRLLMTAASACAIAGLALFASAAPASATTLAAGGSKALVSQAAAQNLVVEVQRRGRRWRSRAGAAAAAGVIGGIIGGIIAAQPRGPVYYEEGPVYYEDEFYPDLDAAEAYCARRFKSWDPISRTYLGYDGRRHPCP
jgi:hypothetical protein